MRAAVIGNRSLWMRSAAGRKRRGDGTVVGVCGGPLAALQLLPVGWHSNAGCTTEPLLFQWSAAPHPRAACDPCRPSPVHLAEQFMESAITGHRSATGKLVGVQNPELGILIC